MNIAIIFAKEDAGGFNRCTFPILGRPVAVYPVLAALAATRINRCFVSTSSERIRQAVQGIEGVALLVRQTDQERMEQEFETVRQKLSTVVAEPIDNVVLLYGNSPCVLGTTLDSALETIEADPSLDAVVSAVNRREFAPEFACQLTHDGLLEPLPAQLPTGFAYFADYRFTVVRFAAFANAAATGQASARLFGPRQRPFLQDEGVADIDYIWQVPMVERWLREHGFTDQATPYRARSRSVITSRSAPSTPSSLPSAPSPLPSALRRVFISTVPFGAVDPYPVDLLRRTADCEFVINPIGRRLKEDELRELLADFDVLIAGTEPITARVMANAPRLKLIARVGIGLDNVDLKAARERGIAVSYTPDAPAPAVAELAVGQMLNASRGLGLADRKVRGGVWDRIQGQRLANLTIGIIGTGRVGSRVLRHLQGFSPRRILANDLSPNVDLYRLCHAEACDKETIYREADIITLHVPLTPQTRRLITARELALMKPTTVLINTSRGGIIDEADLLAALTSGRLHAAAIDVFESEPYAGPLATLDNCFLTCHMGSCSADCRAAMERQATDETIGFLRHEPLRCPVPDAEYETRVG